MKLFVLQPAFTVDVRVDKETAISRLRNAIASEELRGFAESAGTVFDFKIESTSRRFWSPHLSAQFSETDDGSQLFARFSPRPEIWTMFIAFYFVVAILMSLAAIVGYVQWSLGYSPSALLLIPLGTVAIIGLHLGSLAGQSLSADQMELLRSRFDRAIELAFGDTDERKSCDPMA
ncbi:single stranded DNA-binding domain-containing protein [Neorhodopirellula pilleata]|uniref:Uncharacterized protein n=1 Tax=Neorhodopirellula pilleata TaxID=2714738 RepID=A0A5C6A6J2_9BACT|nr:hypothetical protein [Neorhodopirellula pilleata]TWT94898.1 hypothetical protein Pla100_34690 [Neorhodopirellula pilleata]